MHLTTMYQVYTTQNCINPRGGVFMLETTKGLTLEQMEAHIKDLTELNRRKEMLICNLLETIKTQKEMIEMLNNIKLD